MKERKVFVGNATNSANTKFTNSRPNPFNFPVSHVGFIIDNS